MTIASSEDADASRLSCGFWVGVLVVAACFPVSARAACDVRVIVRNARGLPIEAPILAAGLDGRTIARTSSANGIAELCDVGIKEFSIIVGSDRCGRVTISRLRTTSHTLTLDVVLEYCHEHILFTSCQVLIRVRSESKPLAGASLRVNGQDVRGVLSDELGRIRTALQRGSRQVVEASAGDLKGHVEIDCGAEKDEVEVTIDLTEKENRPEY